MIIDNFNIIDISRFPSEAYPPLIVNPNTQLPLSVPFETFQLIRWRYSNVLKFFGLIEHSELSARHFLNIER